ncbi:MAG: hypothetical protein ACREID_09435, partial [Planctomycetota bacterium]
MAARELKNLRIRLSVDEAGNVVADLSEVARGLDHLEARAKRAGVGFGQFGASVIKWNQAVQLGQTILSGLTRGLGALVDFGRRAVEASNEQEDSTAALNQALRSSGQYTKEYSGRLQGLASELQRTTRFGDDQVLTIEK